MRQLKITQSITGREGALEKYLQDVSHQGRITPEQEVELSQRIKNGDKSAINELVTANLRFVVSVAKQYQCKGITLNDLINEGNIGLIRAAERFDETKGFKFISYAVWWIRQAITSAIGEQGRTIRLPSNQINMLNKINHAIATFEQENERKPSVAEIAELTGIPDEKVAESLRQGTNVVSADTPIGEDEDGTLYDLLPDGETTSTDEQMMKQSMHDDIQTVMKSILTERDVEILNKLYGIGCRSMTVDELSAEMNLSRERIRQIRERGILKMRHSGMSSTLRSYL